MVDFSRPETLIVPAIEGIAVAAAALLIVAAFNRYLRKIAEERAGVKRGRLRHASRFFQVVVYLVALLVAFWIFEVDITGLLAGLGIGALVIGFALKDVIENWVSGIILMSGRTYQVGDVIRIGDLTGVVTDMTFRTTKLKTYDRNEIIVPNAILLKQNIVNLTGGKPETVASIPVTIDYSFDAERAKGAITAVLRAHPKVIVDDARRREIRFVVRVREWTVEIEALFWINDPENEEFIKSVLTESIKKALGAERILPPIPALLRRDFMPGGPLGSGENLDDPESLPSPPR